MGVTELGVLKRLSPKQVWPNEAADFTPWLAEHLKELGDAIGMDLDLQRVEVEAPVGDFSLDLLAHDVGRDQPVVIENQLGATDHDHLGKLLTYAAGYDAGAIIWIAHEIRDEHRQALDWLNQHMEEDINVFGVVVEVLQIDGSRPAYNFRPVAFPNEWSRERGPKPHPATPRGEAYRAFFQSLVDVLRVKHKFTGIHSAPPTSWVCFASGVSGITYGANFAKGDRARVEIYSGRSDAATNKSLFEALAADKAAIEKEFDCPLEWERLDEKIGCRLAIYRKGTIGDSPAQLDEIRQWMIDHLLRMKKTFGPRIARFSSSAPE